jgi:threonylcarbamoyladenosine tRNA methylthiotransferase MtaB
MAVKLKTSTLGCKVNQYETQFVREGLERAGYEEAQPHEEADLCIVNTCTVTNEGDAKSRQLIRRLANENPHSRIVVMGCYATRAPEEVSILPNVTEVVTDKRELPDLLGRFGVIDIPNGISEFGERHRAYVKVQDGCLLRCSYCIIPFVRPKLNSRPLEEILDEVRRLRDNGYQEVVLTGIHLGHYGVDWNWNRPKEQWTRLADLVRAIVQIEGDFRVRLSSIEATEVTRELIEVMQQFPDRICPHLHVCLQSGSDAILRKMKRRWSSKLFVDRCQLVREALDEPAFTTDVIVGFPGETPADFAATCRISEQVGFSKIHIFPFSARRGTPAAEMTDVVTKQVKKERRHQLAEIEQQQREQYFQRLLGRPLQVLVESAATDQPGWLQGTSARYVPVKLQGPTSWIGQLIPATARGVENKHILANPLTNSPEFA